MAAGSQFITGASNPPSSTPAQLRCAYPSCEAKEVWVCLECLQLGCGRSHKKHALHHYTNNPAHAVCLNMSSTMVWCYACDDELVSDKLGDLRRAIRPARGEDGKKNGRGSAVSRRATTRGIVGLTNVGNSCFMNASLQCLAHTPTLQRHFRKVEKRHKKSTPPQKLIVGLTNWFNNDWKTSQSSYAPDDIFRVMPQINPMFQGFGQHDSQEFLRCVLDVAHEELRDDVPKHPELYLRKHFGAIGSDAAIPSNAAGNGMSDEKKKEGLEEPSQGEAKEKEVNPDEMEPCSVVKRIFGGRIVSNVKCLNCLQISRKIDPMYDISVPIPSLDAVPQARSSSRNQSGDPPTPPGEDKNGNRSEDRAVNNTNKTAINFMMQKMTTVTSSVKNWFVDKGVAVTDCLYKFCEPEILTGRDQYLCEKCKIKNDCEKSIKLLDLPEILCIHIKRFRYDGSAWFGSKNSKIVTFPLNDLDVAEFLDPASKEEETTYRLIGIVQHIGAMGEGHYIAYCRHYKTKEWYEFDDSRTQAVSPETVEKAEPYILFYQKCPSRQLRLCRGKVKDDKRRLQTLLHSPSPGPELLQDVCYISNEWYQRLQTSSLKTSIDNYLFLCPHGKIGITDDVIQNKFIPISKQVYRQLVEQYGGGPMIESVSVEDKCKACSAHLKAYNKRKRLEYEMVQKYDTRDTSDGKYWYLVDAQWVAKWKKYVDQGTKIYDMKEMQAPGQISFERILDVNGVPKPHLQARRDYIGVNSMVWAIFVHVHGCKSPALSRISLDIYSEPGNPHEDPVPPAAELDQRYEIGWRFVDVCKGDMDKYTVLFGARLEKEETEKASVALLHNCVNECTSVENVKDELSPGESSATVMDKNEQQLPDAPSQEVGQEKSSNNTNTNTHREDAPMVQDSIDAVMGNNGCINDGSGDNYYHDQTGGGNNAKHSTEEAMSVTPSGDMESRGEEVPGGGDTDSDI